MPISPSLRHLYGAAWRATRRRILERAGGRFEVPPGKRVARYVGGAKCEQCGVPDRIYAVRAAGWWLRTSSGRPCSFCLTRMDGFRRQNIPCSCDGTWITPLAKDSEVPAAHFPMSARRIVVIVITVGHLNHTAGDDRDDNLNALCQWCHLHHDQDHHKASRSTRKDRSRPLLNPADLNHQLQRAEAASRAVHAAFDPLFSQGDRQ